MKLMQLMLSITGVSTFPSDDVTFESANGHNIFFDKSDSLKFRC